MSLTLMLLILAGLAAAMATTFAQLRA